MDKVLEVKRILEKKRAKELADSIKAFNREQYSLDQLWMQREGLLQEMRTRMLGIINLDELTPYYGYLGRLTDKILMGKSKLEELRQQVDDRRDKYFAANREKRVLERLRERKYEDYLYKAGREEQSFLDEIANRRMLS